MAVRRQSLTIGTKVGIMTHSTLVSVTQNVGFAAFAFAERTIAIYAMMTLRTLLRKGLDRLKQRDEVMSRMLLASSFDTRGAVVPVRTIHAFMAYAVDVL